MILFGAGSSVPFDIPGMAGFTGEFITKHGETSELIANIKDAISKSEETVGISFSFDLETLLSVLNDLSGFKPEKPISVATASLLLREGLHIKTARKKYRDEAVAALEKLTEFIFITCMQPIKRGMAEGNFRFLNHFYGPLMSVLNKTNIRNLQGPVNEIYSTNWDLCFKKWADYINVPISEWIEIDKQSYPIFRVVTGSGPTTGFHYTPLHGSLDLIRRHRLKGEGSYEEICKIADPIGYFEDKPGNIKDVFMIYPLEAVGYEESVKSPYLDMLNHFRSLLRNQSVDFIIGYSLRDPTIGSIFEEVIAERIRLGNLSPLSEDLNARESEVADHAFKIVVIKKHSKK